MDWKNQLTKTPYLVLFIILITIGVGTAAALITITLSGDVIITGGLGMTGDKITDVGTPTVSTDAATKAYVDSVGTGSGLSCNNQLAIEAGVIGFIVDPECVLCFGIPSTEPTSCSGNGQCVGIDSCVCEEGFSGDDCSNNNP